MAIRINNKDYLNYEEQVLKNKKDVEELMLKLRNVSKYGLDRVNMNISLEAAMGGEYMRFSKILTLSYRVNNYKITFTPLFKIGYTDDELEFERMDIHSPIGTTFMTIEKGNLYTLSYEDDGTIDNPANGKLTITKDGIVMYNSSNILSFRLDYGNLISFAIKSIELW